MNQHGVFNFFCSWSGGKDSCLALYRMLQAGHRCKSLLTVIDETGIHSRSHRLTKETLKIQAHSMGIPIVFPHTTWDNYKSTFKQQINYFKTQTINHGVFGDIDLEPHREWVEHVCREESITPHEPLWQENRKSLVSEFINAGFKARIVVVNTKLMPEEFLGRVIDDQLAEDLESIGVDACGENGEYHSFVYDGPLFKKPVIISEYSIERDNEYSFLPLTVK